MARQSRSASGSWRLHRRPLSAFRALLAPVWWQPASWPAASTEGKRLAVLCLQLKVTFQSTAGWNAGVWGRVAGR